MLRKLISWALFLLVPCSLIAQETGAAMLYGTGAIYLNGSQLANSSAVANGDAIQTKENGAGNLSGPGWSAVIQSNTIARFQKGGLALDRGSVSIATGKGFSVFARDYKITPATGDWTEYYVTRQSGAIEIMARKNNVTVSCGPNTVTIKEGQQISSQDAADCGIVGTRGGAVPATKGPILSSRWAEYAAVGAGGALLGWTLAHGDNPVSPSVP
jgi:hypothetical protein